MMNTHVHEHRTGRGARERNKKKRRDGRWASRDFLETDGKGASDTDKMQTVETGRGQQRAAGTGVGGGVGRRRVQKKSTTKPIQIIRTRQLSTLHDHR
jgi:hypothetical protein